MPLKTTFQIVESPTEILEPITKFGGQPVWIADPRWSIGLETGEQMMFLGQIYLNQELFPESDRAIAYLFFAGESEPLYNEATAIVIQSEESVYTNGAPEIELVSEATGPTLYEWDEDRQAIYKEYRVVLNPIENEDSVPLEERYAMNDLDCDGSSLQDRNLQEIK